MSPSSNPASLSSTSHTAFLLLPPSAQSTGPIRSCALEASNTGLTSLCEPPTPQPPPAFCLFLARRRLAGPPTDKYRLGWQRPPVCVSPVSLWAPLMKAISHRCGITCLLRPPRTSTLTSRLWRGCLHEPPHALPNHDLMPLIYTVSRLLFFFYQKVYPGAYRKFKKSPYWSIAAFNFSFTANTDVYWWLIVSFVRFYKSRVLLLQRDLTNNIFCFCCSCFISAVASPRHETR